MNWKDAGSGPSIRRSSLYVPTGKVKLRITASGFWSDSETWRQSLKTAAVVINLRPHVAHKIASFAMVQ